jgi:hypothetical protein
MNISIPRIGEYNIAIFYLASSNFLYNLIGNDYAVSNIMIDFVTQDIFRLQINEMLIIIKHNES